MVPCVDDPVVGTVQLYNGVVTKEKRPSCARDLICVGSQGRQGGQVGTMVVGRDWDGNVCSGSDLK